jgi:hypothetical protein
MFGRSCLSSVSLALAIGFVVAPSLLGQSAVALEGGVATVGDEYESYSLFETGVRLGSLTRKRVNPDVRITTFPRALTAGIVVLATDLDAAFVLPLGKGTVMTPRAGLSLVGGVSADGAAGAPGVNFGIGVVAGLTSPIGLRLDYSHRTFFDTGEERVGASSFSIGIVWVH